MKKLLTVLLLCSCILGCKNSSKERKKEIEQLKAKIASSKPISECTPTYNIRTGNDAGYDLQSGKYFISVWTSIAEFREGYVGAGAAYSSSERFDIPQIIMNRPLYKERFEGSAEQCKEKKKELIKKMNDSAAVYVSIIKMLDSDLCELKKPK